MQNARMYIIWSERRVTLSVSFLQQDASSLCLIQLATSQSDVRFTLKADRILASLGKDERLRLTLPLLTMYNVHDKVRYLI